MRSYVGIRYALHRPLKNISADMPRCELETVENATNTGFVRSSKFRRHCRGTKACQVSSSSAIVRHGCRDPFLSGNSRSSRGIAGNHLCMNTSKIEESSETRAIVSQQTVFFWFRTTFINVWKWEILKNSHLT